MRKELLSKMEVIYKIYKVEIGDENMLKGYYWIKRYPIAYANENFTYVVTGDNSRLEEVKTSKIFEELDVQKAVQALSSYPNCMWIWALNDSVENIVTALEAEKKRVNKAEMVLLAKQELDKALIDAEAASANVDLKRKQYEDALNSKETLWPNGVWDVTQPIPPLNSDKSNGQNHF